MNLTPIPNTFRPHPLLRQGDIHTIVASYLHVPMARAAAHVHLVHLGDGDRVVLEDDRPGTWQAGSRVALFLHGLAGSSRSPYCLRIAKKLNDRGVRTFRMSLRSAGIGQGFAQRPYHAGCSEDVVAALEYLAAECPESPVTLLGFSMGGNIALKLLGEVEDLPPGGLDSAIAVCPPIDLATCCEGLSRGFKQLYDRNFVHLLLKQFHVSRKTSPMTAAVRMPRYPRRLIGYDSMVTAPIHGFGSVADYYRLASSAAYIPRIRIPSWILAAADDPVVPARIFQGVDFPDCVSLTIARHGGHLGFVGVRGHVGVEGVDGDRRWMDWRLVECVMRHDTAVKDRTDGVHCNSGRTRHLIARRPAARIAV